LHFHISCIYSQALANHEDRHQGLQFGWRG
jgi:hypothetical protein